MQAITKTSTMPNFTRVFRFVVGTILMLSGAHVAAADLYSQYLSNLYLLESRQALVPDQPIQHSDPENGKLLKAVLAFESAMPMIATYFINLQAGISEPNLPKLVAPMLNRYQKAFVRDPQAYEAEYLDAVEITAFLLDRQTELFRSRHSSTTFVQGNQPSSDDKRGLLETMQRLAATTQQLHETIKVSLANSLRKEVASGRLTDAGSNRALRIADSLSPLATIQQPPLNLEASLARGEKVYLSNCVICHQRNGEGMPGAIPALTGAPSLRAPAALVDIIVKGQNAMPSLRHLSAVDIATVATYARAKFGQDNAPLVTVDSVREILQREGTRR